MSNKPVTQERGGHIELRTGTPYATLIADQRIFAEAFGEQFGIPADHIIPTAGTTGAIEAVRNHVMRTSPRRRPVVLTVSPGYWRARQSFQGLGFAVEEVKTEADGFAVVESRLIERAAQVGADLVYLSLPNNPTGAIFEPGLLIEGLPEETTIVFDMTLPRRDVSARTLVGRIYGSFKGRKNLYLIGSTSKSHGTAKHRIGWAVCACWDDAESLRCENRNVVSSYAIHEGIRRIAEEPPALATIEKSFAALKEADGRGTFEIVRPERSVESGYVLIKVCGPVESFKKRLADERIQVMWGSEFGLSDEYVRLEMIESSSIELFVAALGDAGRSPRRAILPRADIESAARLSGSGALL